MTTLFRECDLWSLVDGSRSRPDPGEEGEEVWGKENELAKRYILEALDDDQLIRIMDLEDACEMWSKLVQVNESTTGTRKSVLIHEATNHKMRKGESAREYVTRFSEIMLQLRGMNTKVDEDIQKVWLLKGLSKDYSMLKIAIQNRSDLDNIDSVMRAIEDHYESNPDDFIKEESDPTDEQAMAVLKKKYRNDQKDIMERTSCHKCHKKGH